MSSYIDNESSSGSGVVKRGVLALSGLIVMAACGPSVTIVPDPRPLVNRNGARLIAEQPELQETYEWVTDQITEIEENPSFLIVTNPATADVMPWETLEVTEGGDTARVQYQRAIPDLQQVYQIYAHLHIVQERGEIGAWLPDSEDLRGWDLELAIVDRMAEAWLLGRASYDFPPYPPVDRLIYARQDDMLEPLMLSLRGYQFPEARDAWLEANPAGEEAFQAWYRQTFGTEPDPIVPAR